MELCVREYALVRLLSFSIDRMRIFRSHELFRLFFLITIAKRNKKKQPNPETIAVSSFFVLLLFFSLIFSLSFSRLFVSFSCVSLNSLRRVLFGSVSTILMLISHTFNHIVIPILLLLSNCIVACMLFDSGINSVKLIYFAFSLLLLFATEMSAST